MNTWYPELLNIFYRDQIRSQWSKILHNRMESFFRTISLIMANQLRVIIEESVKEFIKLLLGDENDSIFTSCKGKPPVFAWKLLLADSQMRFEPALEDLPATMNELFDRLLTSLDRIPRVESQLFSTSVTAEIATSSNSSGNSGNNNSNSNTKQPQYQPEICLKIEFAKTFPAFVERSRQEIKEGLWNRISALQNHCKVYDQHSDYINQSASKAAQQFVESQITSLPKQVDVSVLYLNLYFITHSYIIINNRKYKSTARQRWRLDVVIRQVWISHCFT